MQIHCTKNKNNVADKQAVYSYRNTGKGSMEYQKNKAATN